MTKDLVSQNRLRLELVKGQSYEQPHPASDIEEVRRIAESTDYNRWTLFAAVAVAEQYLIGKRGESPSKELSELNIAYGAARKLCERILKDRVQSSRDEIGQHIKALECSLRKVPARE